MVKLKLDSNDVETPIKLVNIVRDYKDARYLMGADSKKSIDCSHYVNRVLTEIGTPLPTYMTTKSMWSQESAMSKGDWSKTTESKTKITSWSKEIKEQLQIGDLIVMSPKNGWSKSDIGHAGIVYGFYTNPKTGEREVLITDSSSAKNGVSVRNIDGFGIGRKDGFKIYRHNAGVLGEYINTTTNNLKSDQYSLNSGRFLSFESVVPFANSFSSLDSKNREDREEEG